MQNGHIIEHGSHDNLLRLKGKYFDLWANQIQLLDPDNNSNDKLNDKLDGKAARSRSHSTHKGKGKASFGSSRYRSKSPQKERLGPESCKYRSKSPQMGDDDVESSRSRSKSPQKGKAGIVNDLDPERNHVELSKLAELSIITEEGNHSMDNEGKKIKVSIRNTDYCKKLIKPSIPS